MARRAWCLLAMGAWACTPGRAGTATATDPALGYCAVVTAAGHASWSGTVVTRCAPSALEVDGDVENCTHFRRDASGAERELSLPGVRLALDAGGGALVLLGDDGALSWRGADGSEQLLAPWAMDPSVGSGGSTVAYLSAAPEGIEADEHGRELIAGADLSVVLHPIGGAPSVLAVDPLAASPWPLPDGSGVLFVSARTGLASIFRARAGEPEVQLTNVGLEDFGQDAAPVPGGELAWLPGPRPRAVFSTQLERDEIWLLDAETGETTLLGPGARPRVAGEEVLALGGAEGGCAVRYAIGGAP